MNGKVKIILSGTLFLCNLVVLSAQQENRVEVIDEKLIYHPIHLDAATKTILPWYHPDPGIAFNHVIHLVWDFWINMRTDFNGLPYYMNHQVWRGDFDDRRGIGGDQLSMALSSWNLLYGYTGDETVKENMKFVADYYLSHSLSPEDAAWPHLPYPYNTLIYSGKFDGDMVLGKDFTQPDKAGSFGLELVKLYKMTNTRRYPNITDKVYLGAAIHIANTLAKNMSEGDEDNSPLPFKVNAWTGEVGMLKNNTGDGKDLQPSSYTSNWSGTMELFLSLVELNAGNVELYRQSFQTLLAWMRQYPLKNNKWGPFFEDIPGWSDTQINAVTFAQFMMNHPEYFPNWKSEVKGIFQWVYERLGNRQWEKYGVVVVNEQTAYQTPGNSHTSRQASAELQYAALTRETDLIPNARLALNWATYMVDVDGKNRYPWDDVWLTDGYGDYIRHYLRAMAALPELAPAGQNHLLASTSIIQHMEYAPELNKFLAPELPTEYASNTIVHYRTYDAPSEEVLRLVKKPSSVLVDRVEIQESNGVQGDWSWEPLEEGGVLRISKEGYEVVILQ